MTIKNKFEGLAKQMLNGSMFAVGLLVTVLGVTAFQELNTDPSTPGNQSLSSPIPANMINYNDCQTKSDWIDSANEFTLSCDAGYVIVDHDCQLNRPGSADSNRFGRSYCISERTSAGIHQLRVQSRMYSGSSTTSHRTSSAVNYISRTGGHANIMCCKLGL